MINRIRRNSPILLLTLAHGIVDFYINILPAVAPSLALYMGVPLGSLVALFGVGQLVCNLVQPVAGVYMGNHNMRWLIWLGLTLAVLPAFIGWAPGFFVLAALILLGAVGTGLFHPEGVLSAHDVTGDKAYLGIPLFMAGGTCFGALAAPVSIQCVKHLGYPWLAALAIPGIILALYMYVQRRDERRNHPSVAFRPRSKRITQKDSSHMAFLPLLAVGACFSMANALIYSLLSSHYELTYGPTSRSWVGWSLLLFGGGGALGSFLWGAWTKRHGFYRMVILSQLAATPLMVWIAYASSPIVAFLVCIPLGLVGASALFPVAVTLAKNASGFTQSMRASLLMGGNSCLSSLVVMLAGWLLSRGVNSSYFIVGAAVASFIAIVLAVWQLRGEKAIRIHG